MARRSCLLIVVASLLLLVSCERAQRYPAIVKGPATPKPDGPDPRLSWIEPAETRDIPILFVSEMSDSGAPREEWSRLEKYWNAFPAFPAGLPTVSFAQPGWQALTAFALVEHSQAIKIKVPRGLPDPTPNFPPSNPPTVGKWRLGKALFHQRSIPVGADVYACASCHKPEEGFTERSAHSTGGSYNTLGLINVAFNRRQFWDGRVRTLEETLVRGLDDEQPIDEPTDRAKAFGQHNWGGFVSALVSLQLHNEDFNLVFGVEHPTQDTVAQALATYLRTILSGDSLYDRANQVRLKNNAKTLTDAHFLEALNDDNLGRLRPGPTKKLDRAQTAVLLAQGHELFHGKARCVQCHAGPLFSDQDYHNVGIDDALVTETGRALQVPVGLKEARLIGAYRTPSLRNLTQTAPYFHDGSQSRLPNVVDYYDSGVKFSLRLAKPLLDGARPQQLRLGGAEKEALVLFLRALDGTPVDPILSALAK